MLLKFSNSIHKLKFFKEQFIGYYSTHATGLRYLVPDLRQTLTKYEKYIKPLVPENEYQHTQMLINDFLKPDGEGELLQKLLLKRAHAKENWLSDWWTNVAYLDYRDPVVINSNPGVRLPIENFDNNDKWLQFSVNLLTEILKYKLLIDSNELPQDFLKTDPLCMNQYYTLFNACRIPGVRRDTIYTGRSQSVEKNSRISYITVVHNNRFFMMDVIDQKSQQIYSKDAIFRGFCKILELSQNSGEPIGLLTAENRNTWGTSFTRLKEIPKNSRSFSYIQKSILLFCLDKPVFTEEYKGENPDSIVARNMLHGNGYKMNSSNRWFDKTLQVIVSSDGACGVNYEHTPAEAPPVITIIDYAYKNMSSDDLENSLKIDSCPVIEIEFELDEKSTEEIDASKNNINRICEDISQNTLPFREGGNLTILVRDLELHAVSFFDFGKKNIKALNTSPDAFIQMGIQLGYFNLHKCPGSTYESGSLRRFHLGRTDTIRSCSPEAIEFCKSVNNSNSTLEEQKECLLLAIGNHVNYTKEVLKGQGIDRHLLGLKLIAVDFRRNIPDLFMDTSFSKAFHHVLSTSQGPSSVDLTMCFGPLVPDGYGFCYNPRHDKINFCISAINSSPSTNALSLSKHITDAWRKIFDILQR